MDLLGPLQLLGAGGQVGGHHPQLLEGRAQGFPLDVAGQVQALEDLLDQRAAHQAHRAAEGAAEPFEGRHALCRRCGRGRGLFARGQPGQALFLQVEDERLQRLDLAAGGQELDLHPLGARPLLLELLVGHAGRAFSREYLLERVWGYEFGGADRTVDTHVLRLRKKLGALGDRIETVWGVGYRFARPTARGRESGG